ncbi:MAG TPA: cytochrome c3 family protein [Geobacteraceae bacterium]
MFTSNLAELFLVKWRGIIVLMVIMAVFNIPAVRGEEMIDQPQGHCFFSERLKNPAVKSAYLKRLAYFEEGAASGGSDVEAMYGNIKKADYATGDAYRLDPISYECITCHDGSSAPATGYSHPVGMDYDSSTAFSRRHPLSRQFISRGALNPDIVLIGGKVGCLSCHNPLNPERNHLVASNDRSTLCLSCHIK